MNKAMHSLFFSGLLIALSPFAHSPRGLGYEIPTDVSLKTKPATIKVLLVERADNLILEAKGKYQICNPINHYVISSGSFSKRAKVTHDHAGIKWGELIPGAFQLRIVPKDSETTLLVNGKQYRGCVDIYDMDGKFMVINEVDAESYLRSTLSNEFKNDMNPELIRSLVIAARTHLYYDLSKKNADSLYHVAADEVSYKGHGATLVNPELERAISDTRHAIMTYEGAPFPATWTENSAGRTADYSSIYRRNAPSPHGVAIPLAESDRQKMGWSFSIAKEQLARIAQVHNINQISLFSDKASGKVYAMKVSDQSENQQITFTSLQNALGDHNLKSNDFTIDVKGDQITFKGYGKGLGTGICMYSADLMAKQGADALKILTTFFPDVKVEKMRSLASEK